MECSPRELLRRFCMETSILGLKYFYIYPDKISRCFWSATMLSITTAACALAWLLYSRFSDIPTRITIENQYEPLVDVPYPAITICSPNQITISAMNHFNRTLVDGNLTLDLTIALPYLLGFYAPLGQVDTGILEHLQSLIDLNRYTIPEVMSALPQRCDDFLRLCVFRRRLYPNCRGLLRPILTPHGLCCIFNSVYYFKGGRKNEKDPNFVSWMVLPFELSEGLTVVTDYNPMNALDKSIINAGATRVMFNDVSEFPSDDEMKLVYSNSESYHVLHASYTYCSEEVEQLPAWSRKCYFKDEYSLPFFGDYHNADCDTLCYVKAVENTCHCHLLYVPNLRVGRTCNVTSLTCILNVKFHVYRYVSPEECDCPRDCNYRRYNADTAIGNLLALPYVINKPYSSLVFNKSTSILNFFFTSAVYSKQKQETVMSLISLTSNLGGVFGLCLGCSAISVLEILFCIYIASRNYLRRRLRRCTKPIYPIIQ